MAKMRWLGLSVVLVGCGNAAVDAYHHFLDEEDQIYCAAEIQCCPPSSAATQASCLSFRHRVRAGSISCLRGGGMPAIVLGDVDNPVQCASGSSPPPLEDRLAQGAVSFAAAPANDCLSLLRATAGSCDSPADFGARRAFACASAFLGTRLTGASCRRDEECVSGLFCNGAPAGVCAPYSSPGAPCAGGKACEPASGTTCLPSRVCGAPLADGAPCPNNDDAVCQSYNCGSSGSCDAARTVRDVVCGLAIFPAY